MKLQNIYNPLSECTSVAIKISGQKLLAKNRDRTYNPVIKLVRERINGVEVLYMHDLDTDYSEGMNELGIGIVNTTLQGKADEKEIKATQKTKKLSGDGNLIRKALGHKKIEDILETLDLGNRGLGGHTTIAYPKGFVSVEKIRQGKPIIKHLDENELIIRTNHGLEYSDQGYQFGPDRESSVSRSFYATKAARQAKKPEDLLVNLRQHHGIPGYLEPYRTNYKVWTSSQILLNLTKLEMIFVIDENTEFLGVQNLLPMNYKAKIKLRVFELDTEYKASEVSDIKEVSIEKED